MSRSVPAERVCEECGEIIIPDASPGVWLHDADYLGEHAFDLNEDHVARPEEDEEQVPS